MGTVDMKYVDYLYKNHTRQNTRKNLAGDLFRELADVIGADTVLLKENRDPNRRYSFSEGSVPLILEMLETAKSREGKRLRCWDYAGAGALTIHYFIEAFCCLYERNGVAGEDLQNAILKMYAQTDFITIVGGIDPDLYFEVGNYLFAPNEQFPNEEDRLSASDKFVFLSYLSDNPEVDPEDVLRAYWFFREDCEFRDRQAAIPVMQAILREQTPEDLEQYKDAILKHIKLDDALDNDEDVIKVIHRLNEIAGGKGKLGDKKELCPLIDELVERVDYHADQLGFPVCGTGVKNSPNTKSVPNISVTKVRESYQLLNASLDQYAKLKAHRLQNPSDADNITIREMMFKDRYGFPMF